MIDLQLVRQVVGAQRRAEGLGRLEAHIDLVSPFLALPMLRGVWVASVNNAGNWYDLSKLGKTLSYQGNPTLNYSGLVPYWDLDGTGDYFNRADEADLDIIGTETYVASAVRGLTLGGWFWLDALGSNRGLISKYNTGPNQRAYMLYYRVASTELRFIVSVDGTATTSVETGADLSTGAWLWIVGRFDPSTELKLWVNNVSYTNTVGVPASLFNSNAALEVGSFSVGTNNLDGRVALCFLCAAMLSDGQVSSLFQQTRAAFGV